MPTIEITFGEIHDACSRSLAGFLALPLGAGEMIWAAKIGKRFQEEDKLFNEQFQKLCEKYQTKLDDGNMGVTGDNLNPFNEELKGLRSQKVTISTTMVRVTSDVKMDNLGLVLMDFERFITCDFPAKGAGVETEAAKKK